MKSEENAKVFRRNDRVARNAARTIRKLDAGAVPTELDLDFPNVLDGARGMAFIEAMLASSASNGDWVNVQQI